MTQPRTREEFLEIIFRLQSDMAALAFELEDNGLTFRYRLNLKTLATGARTTETTVECSGSGVALNTAVFIDRQVTFQQAVDEIYPPPAVRKAKAEESDGE